MSAPEAAVRWRRRGAPLLILLKMFWTMGWGEVTAFTRRDIDVSTLPLTGVAEHFTGTSVRISHGGFNSIRAKIRAGAVARPKIRDHAITGGEVANNSLTGRQIDESALQMTRLVHTASGNEHVTTINSWPGVPYPLKNDTYTQPAHTVDVDIGAPRVRFPAGCAGNRWAAVVFEVNRHENRLCAAARRGHGQDHRRDPVLGYHSTFTAATGVSGT